MSSSEIQASFATPLNMPDDRATGDAPCDDVFVFPATAAQRRYWLLDQLEPGNPALNMPLALRLEGPLDVDALELSLNEIVRRHEVLRVTFKTVDRQLMQIILPAVTLTLRNAEVDEANGGSRDDQVRQVMVEEARRPFALDTGPLIRASLLRVSHGEHVLLLTVHHTVCDGWSNGILVRELGDLYAAFAQGLSSPLPELPLQYADYAHWQQEWLASDGCEEQLAYWREQLAGCAPALNLPVDRPGRPARSAPGAVESLLLPAPLARAVKAFAKGEDATMFMVFLAAFNALLYRYTGQNDILVGSPIANRGTVETESLIGLFANTLILRTRPSGSMSFRDFLAQVRDVSLDAVAHEDVPFEKVLEELQRVDGPGRSQPFHAMFIYQTAFMQPREASGLTMTPVRSVSPGSLLDLTQSVVERAEGLRLQLEYNTDLFDAATAARMQDHLQTLLAGAVSNPNRPVAELPLLTLTEQEQLLPDRTAVGSDGRPGLLIHDVLGEQARRDPGAIAVAMGAEAVTFGDFNQSADHVARLLQAAGVGRGEPVGVWMEHSAAALAAVVGALRAGAAVVPLDPNDSPGRLSAIQRDAQVRFVVRRSTANPLVMPGAVIVSPDAGESPAHASADPDEPALPGDLALVVYPPSAQELEGTSVTHGALAARGRILAREYGVRPGDRVGLVGSLAMSALLEELLACWTIGAPVLVAPWSASASGEAVLRWVGEGQMTVLSLPTAIWDRMVDALSPGIRRLPDTLRLVVARGERASSARRRTWVGVAGERVRCLNTYGPTGAAAAALVRELSDAGGARQTDAFRPLPGVPVYLFDANRQPVPAGVPGEIYVGGETLGCGYYGRPDLTDARYVQDLFAERTGARLFGTGDVGRWSPNGGLELLGRVHDRVTVKGYRVDTGTIESALERHPAVREAVVVARESAPGERRLVGYVTLEEASALTETELRAWLRERLPDHRVPSALVVLPRLPLGFDGTVDVASLPAPGREPATLVDCPRDPMESSLKQIWEEVLGVRPIGIRDDFFELGGRSLLAVLLMDRVERAFGKRLPLTILYAGATIADLASALHAQAGPETMLPVLEIQKGGEHPPFFFVHGDLHGAGFYCRDLARHLGEHQPFYALQPHGIDGQDVPPTIEAMAALHLEAMRARQPHGPYFLGGYCNGGLIAYEMARLLEEQGEEVGLLALIHASAKNARFKPLRTAVRSIGFPLRLKPNEQLRWFVRSRNFLMRLGDLSVREQVLFAAEKVRKAISPESATAAAGDGHGPAGEARQDRFDRHKAIYEKYCTAMAGYIPARYSGRVNLFWPRDDAMKTFEDASGWRDVARNVDVHIVPGQHMTCITEHVKDLAEDLRTCLQEARAGVSKA